MGFVRSSIRDNPNLNMMSSNVAQKERIFIGLTTPDRKLEASRGLEMKDLRDLKDVTHHSSPLRLLAIL